MSETVNIPQSCSSPEVIGPDAARCAELDVLAVENLLHRLAQIQTAKPAAVQTTLLGSRKMAAVCAVCFMAMPGCVTAPGTQPIKSGIASGRSIQIAPDIDPVSVKADRLPLITAITDANYFYDANYFDEAKMRDEDDAGEQPALRGTVEDIMLPVSATEPAVAAKRKFRRGTQAALAGAPAETPEPALRAPSLLEKLFSVFVPEFTQPPSQRQT